VKQVDGWYLPDHEEHLPAWWNAPGNKMMMNGRVAYQGRKQQAALKLCKRFRTALDIGAHVGLWTYNLAPVFQTVRAFEPVSEHRECFTFNISADNVIMYPIAIGASHDSVAMRVSPRSSGDTWVAGAGAIAMAPIDAFGFDDVDFVKIDCEGYEENVVRGAIGTIRRCLPVICVEQKRDMATRFGLRKLGAVDLLMANGYRVAEELSGDFICVPS
jgi:FkbM family methyltransferase